MKWIIFVRLKLSLVAGFDDLIVSLVFRLILIDWSSQSNLCPVSSSISPRSIWIIWSGIGRIPGEPALGIISRNTKKSLMLVLWPVIQIMLSGLTNDRTQTEKLNWTLPEFFNSHILPSNYWCKNDQCNAENQNHSKLSRILSNIVTCAMLHMDHIISTLYWNEIYIITLKIFLNFHQIFCMIILHRLYNLMVKCYHSSFFLFKFLPKVFVILPILTRKMLKPKLS